MEDIQRYQYSKQVFQATFIASRPSLPTKRAENPDYVGMNDTLSMI